MMAAMNAILYPVADNADAALARPLGRAAREREAGRLAAGPVRFISEVVGPAFQTREAALDAYAGRIDDDRPGHSVAVAPEDRYCVLREMAAGRPPPPQAPAFAEGRRWPAPPKPPATMFRLSVSYWRVGEAENRAPFEQARTARRKADAAQLDAEALRDLARRPLRPVRPQQPLDIGLFEAPAPEAPHILIPDD
jgi:hypothetical protein